MTDRGGDHGCKEKGPEEGRCCEEARCEEAGCQEEVREEVVLPVVADPDADVSSVYLVGSGSKTGPSVLVGQLKQRFETQPLKADVLFGSGIEPILKVWKADVVKLTLPAHLQDAKVTVEQSYKDEDENMRMVREVNEDAGDELLVKIEARVPAVIETISVSLDLEVK